MGSPRGHYMPRVGSASEVARGLAVGARAERLAASDRAYRLALGVKEGEPTPRALGVLMRGQGRPRHQRADVNGGRHSTMAASR